MIKQNVGPKLLLQINIQVDQKDDTIPDDPFPLNQLIIGNDKQQRYDGKGRQIIKGKNYAIDFDNCVTVCVYDPNEEVLQIKETLSQLSQAEMLKVNFRSSNLKKSKQFDNTLCSILKRSK